MGAGGQLSPLSSGNPFQSTRIPTTTAAGSGSPFGSFGSGAWGGLSGNNTPEPNASLNSQYPYEKGLKWAELKKQLAYLAQYNALSGLSFMNEMQPQQQGLIRRGMSALDPANRVGRTQNFRRDAISQALEALNSRMGTLGTLDEKQANALRLGAINDAQVAGNNYMNQQYDPQTDVQAALASGQMLDPSIASPLLNWYTQLLQEGMGTQAQVMAQQGSGGLGGALGTIAGLAGAAGGLGWSPFK